MTVKQIESAVLRLDPRSRARLAEKLLESLEDLSEEENERLWAEESRHRDSAWKSSINRARSAHEVLRDTRSKLK